MQTENTFYYGRRQIIRYDKTGQPSYTYVALAQTDFLDPQEGDEFAQDETHQVLVEELYHCLRYHYRYNPAMGVLRQVKICWPIPGLAQPAPDLAVIPNFTEPERRRTQFVIADEGTQPTFVLEVTAPPFAQLDLTEKVAIYQQAGVGEYFIVDDVKANTAAAPQFRVLGYQLQDKTYAALAPDEQGRVYSQVLRSWFAVNQAGDQITLIDKRTGRQIVPDADYRQSLTQVRAEASHRASNIAAQLDFLRNET